MASIARKLLIGMLVPYLWRRWRNRDRVDTPTPAPTEADGQLSTARAGG